jgi:hypothetical protein
MSESWSKLRATAVVGEFGDFEALRSRTGGTVWLTSRCSPEDTRFTMFQEPYAPARLCSHARTGGGARQGMVGDEPRRLAILFAANAPRRFLWAGPAMRTCAGEMGRHNDWRGGRHLCPGVSVAVGAWSRESGLALHTISSSTSFAVKLNPPRSADAQRRRWASSVTRRHRLPLPQRVVAASAPDSPETPS